MSFYSRNENIILGVTRDGEDITIRVDRNSLVQAQLEGPQVINLAVYSCNNSTRVFSVLSESVDKPLDYEIYTPEAETTLSLWIDYTDDPFEINCARVTESETDYTVDDLKRKCQRLARLFLASAAEKELAEYMYSLLETTLQKTSEKEFDNYQRKYVFLTKSNPEKAAILKGEVQANLKMLRLIGRVDGESLEPQITHWILSLWDVSHEKPQSHDAVIEDRIAMMGNAAIIPLLKLINHQNPNIRAKAVQILGLIDPKIANDVSLFMDT